MGTKSSLLFASLIASASIYISLFWKSPELPKHYVKSHYWGIKTFKDGEPYPSDSDKIEKFKINIDNSVLTDLKSRLNKTRIVDSLADVNFEYGLNSETLQKIISYWTTEYDWKAQETILNKYDHFKTQIEGISVHFIHVKPKPVAGIKVIPLMLTHGWPGSFWEFYKMIPMLTTAKDGIAFEIVAPSIPGYGFSEAPQKPGFSAGHAARIFVKLMERLGHKKFYYHGGDWGSIIGDHIAKFFPGRILGLHTTMPNLLVCPSLIIKTVIGVAVPSLIYDNPEVESKMLEPLFLLKDKFSFLMRETGYFHIQATKPDTVGTGLNDSPAGLAAYILEKFSTWVNPFYINRPDGGLFEKFTPNELLTNVMIYWVTETITSSARFYKENFSLFVASESIVARTPVKKEVPVGVAAFQYELLQVPKFAAQLAYENLLHYEFHSRGGHFAAFEEPELTSNDIRIFISKCIEYHNNNDKKENREKN